MMGAMLQGMLDVGYAQQQRYERPDFKLSFDILRKNIERFREFVGRKEFENEVSD